MQAAQSKNPNRSAERHGQRCAECDVRSASMCGALDTSELKTFELMSRTTNYVSKQAVFEQGAPASQVFNVTEGMLRLSKSLPDGRRQIIGFALPGDFLGLAFKECYGVTAESITPAKVCYFSRASFAKLVDEKPHLLKRLHEFAGRELSLAQDQMLLLGRKSAKEKIAAFLIGMQSRCSRSCQKCPTVELPMGRVDIADYLGLTIETVSRTLSQLVREKTILIVPNGVRLINNEQLAHLTAA